VKLQPFTADLVPAVQKFNARLRAGGADPELLFPESPAKLQGSNCAIVEEPFLLMEEEEGVVRGGFILKHQDFWLGSDAASVAHFRLPLSEGIVNRKFAGVGLQLVRQALSRQPLLFALGMGGRQQPLPRLLAGSCGKCPSTFSRIGPSGFCGESGLCGRRHGAAGLWMRLLSRDWGGSPRG
jgi:hypothetical protein